MDQASTTIERVLFSRYCLRFGEWNPNTELLFRNTELPSQRVTFENDLGTQLSGVLELPAETPRFFALFSHCFTCTKDLKAIVKISRGLAARGIGVLRFDFTGLGDSRGNFSDTNFETNLADIRAATSWLVQHHQSPALLMGLSLGGAAMVASANQISSVRGLVTLAAPSCTRHLAAFLSRENPEIATQGQGEVTIGGRTYLLKKQLLQSLGDYDLESDLRALDVHHLMIHSPQDETLGFYHSEKLFEMSGGIKSFVTLGGANHLMTNQHDDVEFVARQIDLWSHRWSSSVSR